MQCNIGEKGKAVRLKLGLQARALALVFSVLILTGVLESVYWWYVTGGIAFGGAFAIFEARAGWCIVRAMGCKTPL